MSNAFVNTLIQLGDDHLILGHRLSEWCGHAPMLEEDLAMPNMALDLIGQARVLYSLAGVVENKGRSEDDFAYLRTDREYKNCLLVERPNTDFAHTMLRHFYFAAFMQPFWLACAHSSNTDVLAIASKAEKEVAYHIRHCGEWLIRLGDGTTESASRTQDAVEALHHYTEELFEQDPDRQSCVEGAVVPDSEQLREAWNATVDSVFDKAKLNKPEKIFKQNGGRKGLHTEDFGLLLSQLQYMQRAYPGASW